MKICCPPKIFLVLFFIPLTLLCVLRPIPLQAASTSIVINEIVGNPSGSEPLNEWIELYNSSSNEVNMADWILTDLDTSASGRGTSLYHDGVFIFPPLIVPPGGYVLVSVGAHANGQGYYNNDYHFDFASGDYTSTLYWGRTSGGLNNAGEQIVLLEPIDGILPIYDDTNNYIRGTLVDFVTYGGMASSGNNNIAIDANANGVIDGDEYPGGTDFTNIQSERAHEPGTNSDDSSIALDPNGDDQDGSSDWQDITAGFATPGTSNDGSTGPSSNTLYEEQSGLIINEIVYNQAGGDAWLNEDDEQIELYNPTTEPIYIGNWAITDLKTATSGGNHDTYDYNYHDHVFIFPGLLVPPQGFVVLNLGLERPQSDWSFEGDNMVTIYWGRDRCILNDDGDEVVLLSPIDYTTPVYNDTTNVLRGNILDVVIYNSIGSNDGNDIIIDSNGDNDGDDPGEHAAGGFLNNHTAATHTGTSLTGDEESIALHHNGEDSDSDSFWSVETLSTYLSTTQQSATRPVSGDIFTFYGDGISIGARNDQPISIITVANTAIDQTGDVNVHEIGDRIQYTITLENSGDKEDGISFEIDTPSRTTYVSSSATSGVLTMNGDTLNWTGLVPRTNPVTLYMYVDIASDDSHSGVVSSQGIASFDGQGNNTQNTTSLSDDPDTPDQDDATVLGVADDGDSGSTETLSSTGINQIGHINFARLLILFSTLSLAISLRWKVEIPSSFT
ncbi:lamin tail domain-containing protein [bacterium]|nr:lamin tail domain-containing protein [bacterium]